MRAGTLAESAPGRDLVAGRDRTTLLTYAVLLVITAAAWAHVLASAWGTNDMGGMDMVMTPMLFDGLGFVAAWGGMMAAMMLPSALPMIGLYAATQRNGANAVTKAMRVAVFTLTYVAFWAMTGVPIYFASVALGATRPLPYGIAGVLFVAGIFQVSSLKQVCLRNCRSPLGFLLGHWRAGWRGSLAMGGAHALYCVGCCWALMVVLVAAGTMGLPWVLFIAAVVAAEKLLPHGEWIARVTGVALMLLGVATAFCPELATALRRGGHPM